ncbi:hypothetical protein MPNT_340013 [Candidatus Methylacidithermus pantelleriae]|uniref:Uncharacterized protein n=1 Tax=Candidatus Methylacidithermus pantelleriae TaxID=2744239 RepID=A0A8J2BP12_9BACT|nr:hypothetical protein MPNT_340013 [Candidatus Methylacidithermus pantelleriae]
MSLLNRLWREEYESGSHGDLSQKAYVCG